MPRNKKVKTAVAPKTLDLKPLLVPITILLGAIIISLTVYFSLRGVSFNAGIKLSNQVTPTTDPSVQGAAAANPAATTTIGTAPYLGNKSAKVALVEFSDYECPYCKQFHLGTFDQIVQNYVDTGKILYVFRNFPLSFHDPLANTEALAAQCVQELGGNQKYFDYNKLVYSTTTSNGNGLAKDKLYTFANQIGLDANKFKDCFDSAKYQNLITQDIADGQKAGINGTPGFIIGQLNSDGSVEGVNVAGAQPYANFQAVIEQQLAK